ncbi:MAG: ABC transporter ATP-binding protein [Actinobacteria bacterium]|nr:ABC transporter ATP-binding protein [Actinomycetota bacterium]
MRTTVEVQDLRRVFGPTVAVDGATWHAGAGRITAVLGPNGAGKSTTIECLEGLQRPDGGSARVLGVDPWGASAEHRARVGVMFQDGGLPNTARPVPLLHHLASLYAAPRPVDELVSRLGIGDFARTPLRRMSGGQKQRVGLAAALVGNPEVVFLDEPTAGLDPHARLDVWALIREVADAGATVVVTTHSFDEADRLADDVVVMGRGRVLASGALAEVRGARTLEDRYFALTGDQR